MLEVLHAAADLSHQSANDVSYDLCNKRIDVSFRHIVAHFYWLLLFFFNHMRCLSFALRLSVGHYVELYTFFQPDYTVFDFAGAYNAVEDVDCEGYQLVRFVLLAIDYL